MLAMDVNDNACFLIERVVLEFIASMLAPTKVGVRLTDRHWGLPAPTGTGAPRTTEPALADRTPHSSP